MRSSRHAGVPPTGQEQPQSLRWEEPRPTVPALSQSTAGEHAGSLSARAHPSPSAGSTHPAIDAHREPHHPSPGAKGSVPDHAEPPVSLPQPAHQQEPR